MKLVNLNLNGVVIRDCDLRAGCGKRFSVIKLDENGTETFITTISTRDFGLRYNKSTKCYDVVAK